MAFRVWGRIGKRGKREGEGREVKERNGMGGKEEKGTRIREEKQGHAEGRIRREGGEGVQEGSGRRTSP